MFCVWAWVVVKEAEKHPLVFARGEATKEILPHTQSVSQSLQRWLSTVILAFLQLKVWLCPKQQFFTVAKDRTQVVAASCFLEESALSLLAMCSKVCQKSTGRFVNYSRRSMRARGHKKRGRECEEDEKLIPRCVSAEEGEGGRGGGRSPVGEPGPGQRCERSRLRSRVRTQHTVPKTASLSSCLRSQKPRGRVTRVRS